MEYKQPVEASTYRPRVIIHGGSGNITRENLSPALWLRHKQSLLHILESTQKALEKGASALDAAVHSVKLLENDPLFNAGVGAVFTRSGTIELEASVMVSNGNHKRACSVGLIKHVRHPIALAAEMLRKGDEPNGGGAQGHLQLSGQAAEDLAKAWGLEMCDEKTFWTQKRWDEHKRGLDHSNDVQAQDNEHWDGVSYLPQGTVGCVVLDKSGILCCATSTGGITNKLPGRIGDTPTVGAGFWAEEWYQFSEQRHTFFHNTLLSYTAFSPTTIWAALDCLGLGSRDHLAKAIKPVRRAVAMSGTGNGDSFLRVNAVRTAAALARFQGKTLRETVTWMAGPGGELQQSVGDRWGVTGEGVGGIIGIEVQGGTSTIVFDFNIAMFRAWIDDEDKEHCMVFKEDY